MSQPLFIKAEEILETSESGKYHLHTVLEPIPSRGGYFFSVLAVSSKSANVESLIQILAEQLKRAASGVSKEKNSQHEFERVVEKINDELAFASGQNDWHLSFEKIDALVGMAADKNLFITGTGELTALFLHKTPEQRYQVFNLFRSIKSGQAHATWEKPFTVILDGDLHPGDVFCISNLDLQKDISPEEFNSILATLPPHGAVNKIRQYYPIKIDLALMVIKAEASGMKDFAPTEHDSVVELDATEERTAKILEDQRPRIINLFSSLFKKLPKEKKFSIVKSIIVTIAKLLYTVVKVAWSIVVGSILASYRISIDLATGKRRPSFGKIKNVAGKSVAGARGFFKRLPKTSKYLMLAAIVLLVVFGVSVKLNSRSQAIQEEEGVFEAQLKEVENLRDDANSATIFKDEAKARNYIIEALAKLDELPADTPNHIESIEALRAELAAAMDELRHYVMIPNPPLFGDMKDVSADLSAQAMAYDGKDVYVFGSDMKAYKLSQDEKKLTLVESADSGMGAATEAASDGTYVYYIDDRPGLSVFDPTSSTFVATTIAPGENQRWTDIYSYTSRLYVLYPGGGGDEPQVLRMSKLGGSSFSSPQKWIVSRSTDLSDAVGLAVDGTVFVLKQNGKIVRFTSGSEIDWSVGFIDPPVTDATDLWTDEASNYLYVLEPAMQRLLVLEKASGALAVQYKSEAFVGLTDFVVDEINKKIYLLAGSKVYRIDATYL